MAGEFIWYELMTRDPARAAAFYGPLTGWQVGSEGGDYAHLQAPDGAMVGGMLRLRPEMAGARPGWLAYIAVDDVDAAVAAITAAGGRVVMPARDMENVGRMALVADPQGAPFYVMKPSPPADRPAGPSTACSQDVGHCSWNELGTTDATSALSFYPTLFGWTLPEPMDMGDLGLYHFFEDGGGGLGAIFPSPPDMPVAAWTFYFRVPAIDAAKDAVESGGGQVLMGPHEVPGDDWIVVCTDPEGAAFGLVAARR